MPPEGCGCGGFVSLGTVGMTGEAFSHAPNCPVSLVT